MQREGATDAIIVLCSLFCRNSKLHVHCIDPVDPVAFSDVPTASHQPAQVDPAIRTQLHQFQ